MEKSVTSLKITFQEKKKQVSLSAVMYLTQYFIMSQNGKFCALVAEFCF
jgi:hypothetical protein